MIIDLQQLFDIENERVAIDYSLDFSDIELWGQCPFGSPVHITGVVENRAGIVYLAYTAGFVLSADCDRCLDRFSRDEAYCFTHVLVRELNEEDTDEYILVENARLDLDELVRSDILLSIPTKLLCKDDCKGLCQSCGNNLNHTDCTCSRKECDPRLEALKKLLD